VEADHVARRAMLRHRTNGSEVNALRYVLQTDDDTAAAVVRLAVTDQGAGLIDRDGWGWHRVIPFWGWLNSEVFYFKVQTHR